MTPTLSPEGIKIGRMAPKMVMNAPGTKIKHAYAMNRFALCLYREKLCTMRSVILRGIQRYYVNGMGTVYEKNVFFSIV